MSEIDNNYELLLLDVDGTLVESKGGALPSSRVIEAVKSAADKIDVAIITGRPFEFTKDVISSLGLTGYGVFNGGAEIIDISTGQQIHRQTMSVPVAREAASIALKYGYTVFNTMGSDEVAFTSSDEITESSDKLLIVDVPSSKSSEVVRALEAVKGTVTHPVSAWSDEDVVNITVAHEYASKQHGAEQIMQLLGHAKAQTMAIGDGHNDIPLIQAAGLGIAMGDAPSEVKEIADYVTSSLAKDGVADAIEKFILK